MNDSWEKLDSEAVEREVGNAYKVMYKIGKVFGTHGLDKIADNCETVRHQVESFKKFVPLVQVGPRGQHAMRMGICG
jgi:dynein heavy chain, axonemal